MSKSIDVAPIHFDDLEPDERELVVEAEKVRLKAYAPYSGFRVGAALRGKSGRVYHGCNVENGSFGATICAERAAVVSAVAAGEREFVAIAITATTDQPCPPCGICRQVMSEFAPDLRVLLAVAESHDAARLTLSDLLPVRFRYEIFRAVGGE